MSEIKYKIGDARELIKDLPDNSIDAVVTDPPYEINFMSSKWDRTGIAFDVDFWTGVKRVMKPGAHACVFGFPRTHHRLMCALEDAGFEIRDVIIWLFSQGFPKALNISKAIDKMKGFDTNNFPITYRKFEDITGGNYNIKGDNKATKSVKDLFMHIPQDESAKQWYGWKTSLKPSFEPIILVRKPISERNIALNVLKWGTGGLNIDDCRIRYDKKIEKHKSNTIYRKKEQYDASSYVINYDTTIRYNQQGRYPSNVILEDGTVSKMLDEQTGVLKSGQVKEGYKCHRTGKFWFVPNDEYPLTGYSDEGGASRFFYCAKVSPNERGKLNRHPTVKPIKLVEYLVKLIAPPNGTVLDPFVGSGTTLKACQNLGFNGLGFELDKSNESIIRKRCHLDGNLDKYIHQYE
jgi:site-specific DNA-methyltransferase (adenine-specific)